MSDLYKRIEALCVDKGITITQMCKKSGASRGSLGDLANNRIQSLSANTLQKISEYFKVSVDYLTGKSKYRNDQEVRGFNWGPSREDFDAAFDFAGLLKELREEQGVSLYDLGLSINEVDPEVMENIENGNLPIDQEKAESLCEYLGTNVSQVLFDNGLYDDEVPEQYHDDVREWERLKEEAEEERAREFSKPRLVSYAGLGEHGTPETSNVSTVITNGIYNVPVFESVSAGFGAYASDCVTDYLPVIIKNPSEVESTIAIKVSGDSMYPKIEDGDIIVVRRQTSVDSGDIGVVLLDGDEGLVKKIVYGDDWIELISINPEYKTKRFDGAEVQRLQVVGKVKQIVKML